MKCYLLGEGVLLKADISGEATDLAGDPLHALLGLDDGEVDVVDALNDVGHGVGGWKGEGIFSTLVHGGIKSHMSEKWRKERPKTEKRNRSEFRIHESSNVTF